MQKTINGMLTIPLAPNQRIFLFDLMTTAVVGLKNSDYSKNYPENYQAFKMMQSKLRPPISILRLTPLQGDTLKGYLTGINEQNETEMVSALITKMTPQPTSE